MGMCISSGGLCFAVAFVVLFETLSALVSSSHSEHELSESSSPNTADQLRKGELITVEEVTSVTTLTTLVFVVVVAMWETFVSSVVVLSEAREFSGATAHSLDVCASAAEKAETVVLTEAASPATG